MVGKILAPLATLSVCCSLLVLALQGTALATPVPELDPGTASSGLILGVGGALLLIEKFRHR
jgi:hypothetical protein